MATSDTDLAKYRYKHGWIKLGTLDEDPKSTSTLRDNWNSDKARRAETRKTSRPKRLEDTKNQAAIERRVGEQAGAKIKAKRARDAAILKSQAKDAKPGESTLTAVGHNIREFLGKPGDVDKAEIEAQRKAGDDANAKAAKAAQEKVAAAARARRDKKAGKREYDKVAKSVRKAREDRLMKQAALDDLGDSGLIGAALAKRARRKARESNLSVTGQPDVDLALAFKKPRRPGAAPARHVSGVNTSLVRGFKKSAGVGSVHSAAGQAALKARASKPGHYRAKAILAASRGNTARAKVLLAKRAAVRSNPTRFTPAKPKTSFKPGKPRTIKARPIRGPR